MQRLRDERGAVGVVVALLMVPLIGFAALGVDVGAMWAERQQLQTGADAAALAVAQDCARGDCGTPAATAQDIARRNVNDEVVAASIVSRTSGQVTVRADGSRQHVFAPLIGVGSSQISTSATARWGAPSGGTAMLPLAFSWCEFAAQTGGGLPSGTTERVVKLTKSSGVQGCTGPSRNVVPGGFGWLDSVRCRSTSTAGGVVGSDPGNSVPSSCSTGDFTDLLDQTVLLPLFDAYGGNGANAWYRVYGYAAFRITGYHFGGQYSTSPPQCRGNDRCVTGYFTRFVDMGEAFDYSAAAPQLGASVLSLTD